MRTITCKFDHKGTQKQIERMAKNGAFATSWAINQVIPRTQRWLKGRMNTKLEGGALGFTKSGLQYEKAQYKASNLKLKKQNSAVIFFAKNRFYMKEVIKGGTKKARNKRLPEPIKKNIRLTKAGNIPRNFQQQAILATKNTGVKRAKLIAKGRLSKNVSKRFKDIWVGTPAPPLKGPFGIYKNDKKGGPPKLMVMYKRQQRKQRQIWDASDEAFRYAMRLFPVAMKMSYNKYMKPRRRRR